MLFTGGQRPYELIASQWDAIDWEEKTWTVQFKCIKE